MANIVAGFGVPHTPVFPFFVKRDGPNCETAKLFAARKDNLAAARPDVIVMFDTDHLNTFFLDNLPIFAVGADKALVARMTSRGKCRSTRSLRRSTWRGISTGPASTRASMPRWPTLTRAKEAHIPVILVNTIIPQDDLYAAFVGEDSDALGGLAGKAMADGLAKSGRTSAKVAIVAGSMDEGVAPARAAGFKESAGVASWHVGGSGRGDPLVTARSRESRRPIARPLLGPRRPRRHVRHERSDG